MRQRRQLDRRQVRHASRPPPPSERRHERHERDEHGPRPRAPPAARPPAPKRRRPAVSSPVPTQQLGTAVWQGMRITADAMTPVPFLIYNGTTMQEVKPAKNTSFHLMVLLNDAQTNVVIPYASVWATITQGGKTSFDESLWPMISRYMGPHYGNDVAAARCRHLPADPADLAAGLRPPRRVPGRVAEAAQGDLHLPLEANVVTSARTVTRRLASAAPAPPAARRRGRRRRRRRGRGRGRNPRRRSARASVCP